MELLQDKRILKDMADIFIELTDDGFFRNTFTGTIGESKLRDHKTDTLYLCIVKPSKKWINDLKDRGYDYQLGEGGNALTDFFHTTYFDDTLDQICHEEVSLSVQVSLAFLKGLWGEDIEVELKYDTISRKGIKDKDTDYYIDKYYVRIKKRL